MASPAPTTALILEFATNSVRNTTLATADDDPYFEIVTRFWHADVTKINRLERGRRPGAGEMITVCEIAADAARTRVRFIEEGHSEKGVGELGAWVDSEDVVRIAEGKPGGTFIDADGIEYRWKTHNRNFLLYRLSDTSQTPLVIFHPCKRHFGFWRMSKHAWLEVKPGIKDLERFIASFLLVERHKRHKRLSY